MSSIIWAYLGISGPLGRYKPIAFAKGKIQFVLHDLVLAIVLQLLSKVEPPVSLIGHLIVRRVSIQVASGRINRMFKNGFKR